MAIQRVKVRAEVKVGSLIAYTPTSGSPNIILSFNVNRSRGQPSTFSARLKIQGSTGLDATGPVEIRAGENSPSKRIFTGMVKRATISPCFDDPSYVIVNISGTDVLGLLQGKKFTRRCIATKTSWVTINGVSRKGLKSEKFKYKNEPVVILTDSELGEAANLTSATNLANKNPYDGGVTPSASGADPVTLVAVPVIDTGGST